MRIGIDISQVAYRNTGVANYLSNLVQELAKNDEHELVLFFSSLRRSIQNSEFRIQNFNSKVKIKQYKLPPSVLDLLWNRLHIIPIETFIGDVDLFITSDWTEPPARRTKKATIIYDMIVYKHPEETDKRIVATQKRKLAWVKKESSIVFSISESTGKDVEKILDIESSKIKVIYPGSPF